MSVMLLCVVFVATVVIFVLLLAGSYFLMEFIDQLDIVYWIEDKAKRAAKKVNRMRVRSVHKGEKK